MHQNRKRGMEPMKLKANEMVYARGYKSEQAAYDAICDEISEGLMSECERPREASYKTKTGATRWAIVITADGLSV
jgi:hypothetical protein